MKLPKQGQCCLELPLGQIRSLCNRWAMRCKTCDKTVILIDVVRCSTWAPGRFPTASSKCNHSATRGHDDGESRPLVYHKLAILWYNLWYVASWHPPTGRPSSFKTGAGVISYSIWFTFFNFKSDFKSGKFNYRFRNKF